MAIRFSEAFLALILSGPFIEPAVAQNTEHILDAPFTATLTYSKTGQAPLVMRIARASNGSTYRGAPIHDGNSGPFAIEDVPNHRRLEFSDPGLWENNHTYRLSKQDFRTPSADQYREFLRRGQQHLTDDPDDVKAGRRYHHISLGERSGDGMSLLGVRTEITFDDGTKRIEEHWDSDLGITISRTSEGPKEGEQSSWVVTDIRREEPDPNLFQIPKEYLSDPFQVARTVFIDDQTGIPEVLERVTAQFNTWKWPPTQKPLTIVQQKNAADFTATFTKISVAELEAGFQGTRITTPGWVPASGIKMQIHLRGSSELAFDNAVGSSGTAKGDGSAANTCVSDLWTRVLNTRVGEWPSGTAKPKDSPADAVRN
jgi:hypothetical protein